MAEQTVVETPAATAANGPAALRHSPAEHLADAFRAASTTGERGVSLREIPFATMVGVRVDPASPAGARLAQALGTALPARCGDVSADGASTVFWLGPTEFLVLTAEAAADVVVRLGAALDGAPGAVVDLSANRTTLELAGPSAREVLEKGCALDLHPRAFRPGTAVATVLGPVPVLLWQLDDATYRIFPRASFADYLSRWLLDAMKEYGSPFTDSAGVSWR